jgi:hypothetical protein
MSPAIKITLVVLLIGFVIFRLYRRVRGNIGRQPLQKRWLIVRMLSLLLIGGVALAISSTSMFHVLYGIGGAIIGACIAAYALSHTRIEHTDRGCFYTGHPYIGLGIVGLFVVRLLFNLAMAYSELHNVAAQDRHAILAQMESNPFTLGTLMLVAGYYVVYSLGLLRMTPS